MGFPADRTDIPGLGRLWFDPANACIPVLGAQNPNGALAWSFTASDGPLLAGAQMRWQCIAFAAGNLELSTPGAMYFR